MDNPIEAKLDAAAEKLGSAMKNASEAERAALKEMYSYYQKLSEENPGKLFDVPALFAMGIIGNKLITDQNVIDAAVAYIDADLEICRSRRG